LSEEELNNFKNKLIESTSFPSIYMFKFIVESANRNIALVESLFDAESELYTKESSTGKFTSITVKQVVVSVDEVIDIYKRASLIKGIMFL
jgi:putative lipoic acid-binding regulatory protein